MPTLSAMFRIMDGYSAQLDRIINRTDEAASRVLRTSRNVDDLNDSLGETGEASNKASKGLKAFVSVAAIMTGAKAVMNMADSYINISARLSMVNDGLQTQAELQDKVFAAANRSRGSYEDMASAVAKMNLLAGDSFASNDEAIAFTELLQKSLKVSGAGTAEQQSAFLQLTQSMAAGKLQGDEFRSIMENAPMVAQAISDYMGVTKGELKELSSKGVITAGIIKNAMFSASDDINEKFSEMPMTFADTWNKVKNAGQRAFGDIFEKINKILNSDSVQRALNNFIGMIYLAGDAIGALIDFFSNAWPMITPFIWAAVAALGAYVAVLAISNGLALISSVRTGIQIVMVGLQALAIWATTKATWAEVTAQMGLNSALYACPLVWIIGLVLVVIAVFYAAVAAVNHFAGTSISATGLICGAFAVAGAFIWNTVVGLINMVIGIGVEIYNLIASFANFFANVFNDPVGSIIKLFADLFDFILGIVQSAAKLIDTVFGSNLAGAVRGFRDTVSTKVNDIVGEQKIVMEKKSAEDFQFDRIEYGDAWAAGNDFGAGLEDKFGNLFAGFEDQNAWDDIATDSNPAVFEGTGKDGSVEVNMADEDIQYLRDLAQRDYVAKISNNTLAPNIKVEFGPVTKEADVDAVADRLIDILRDEIATTAEGVY